VKYTNRITKKLELLLDSEFDIDLLELEHIDKCDYFLATIKYKRVKSLINLRVCNDYCEMDINGKWLKIDNNNITMVMFKLLADSMDSLYE